MTTWKKIRLPIGLLAAAAVVAFALWPQPAAVDVAPVAEGRMVVTIDEDGETRVRDRFVISAPVTGRLERIALEPGDRVTPGVVARLYPADPPLLDPRVVAELRASVEAARAAAGQARSDRDRAAAALERALAAARRASNLVEAGAVSREDHETAQTNARTAEAALTAAGFAVSRADRELELANARLMQPARRTRPIDVVSPAGGTVLKRYRESECVVTAGEPLLEIGDPARLEFVVDLLSVDAVRVQAGSRVSIERWGGQAALTGRVRRVEPAAFLKVSALGVDEQRVNVVIDFDDAGPEMRALGDGYRAEAHIAVWEHDKVLTAPIGSLFRRGSAWAVFVSDGARARLRDVTLGERNESVAEVRGGLRAGETVILHPPDTLVDGARIRLR